MRRIAAVVVAVVAVLSTTAAAQADPVGSCRPGQWQNVSTPNGAVRFWWRTDSRTAKRDEKEARAWMAEMHHRIWPKLTGLMGYPRNDAVHSCNGGDGALDFWLTPLGKGTRGTATGYAGQCDSTPGFIEVDPAKATRWTVAHEFFHSLQLRHDFPGPCSYLANGTAVHEDQAWVNESTASWAAHWVYPRDDDEHRNTATLEFPRDRIDHPLRGYDTWVFWLYAERRTGKGAGVVPAIYRNDSGARTTLEAVNHALPGNFRHHFPQFAVYGWNRTPLDDGFRRWDRLKAAPARVKRQRVRLGRQAVKPGVDLQPLSRSYHRFKFDDGRVRYAEVLNTLHGRRQAGASLQALVKIGGQWRLPADWSGRGKVTFCRDKRSQNITELVLVTSHWKHDGDPIRPARQPTVVGSRRCRKPKRRPRDKALYEARYSGTATRQSNRECMADTPTIVERSTTAIRWRMSGGRPLEVHADGGVIGDARPVGEQVEESTHFRDRGPYTGHGDDPPPSTHESTETYTNADDDMAWLTHAERRRTIIAHHGRVYGEFGGDRTIALKIPRGKLRATYTFPVSGRESSPPPAGCTGGTTWEFRGTWVLKRRK